MDLRNKRKHYVKIDTVTTSEHVLALLDIVESDEEDKIDNLMNDSDAEFITEGEITKGKNGNGSNDGGDLLVSDAKVYIVSAENGDDESKKAKKSKVKQNEIPLSAWKKKRTQMRGKSAH